MRVTEVSTVVRYSAEAKGAWRSIEVGATATLTASDESWEKAQAELYQRLGQQLKSLWNTGNGKVNGNEAREGHQIDAQAPQTSTPPTDRPHFCMEHNQEWVKKNGPHGEFYSHPIGGGNEKGSKSWCNESKK